MNEQASSSRTAEQPSGTPELQGFVSATRELKDACANLFPGQMVSVPDLTLLDSMAALQIMDPRMDSGIFPLPDHLIAKGDRRPWEDITTSTFEPHAPLSVEEVCWIIDRLMACEIAWHKGASLSQTIHTCLYVHSLASIHPKSPLSTGKAKNWLVFYVLRPYLIATLKCVGLVWDELTRGNVVDGEDYNGDKAGLSLLEDVRPEEAISLLDETIAQLRQSRGTIDADQAASMVSRMSLRRDILVSIYSLARVDPGIRTQKTNAKEVLLEAHIVLNDAKETLHSMIDSASSRSLMSPSFADAPSRKVTLVFDPWYSRRPAHVDTVNALSAPPPPLPLNLGTPRETIKTYVSLFTGMGEAINLAIGNVGWGAWKAFLDKAAIAFPDEPALSYVRSLWQSMICSNSIIGLQWPLTFIAEAFVYDTTAVEFSALSPLLSAQVVSHEGSIDSVSLSIPKRVDYLMERLAGQLVDHLCSLAQNRSRGKRRLAASYDSLVALSAEAAALDSHLVEVLGSPVEFFQMTTSALQLLTLDTMLQIVYSGFELHLHRSEESSLAYWLTVRISEEKLDLVKDILHAVRAKEDFDVKVAASLVSQLHYARAIALASRAMHALFNYPSFVRQGTLLPWQPSNEEDRRLLSSRAQSMSTGATSLAYSMEALQKVAFAKRFKWLKGRGRPEGSETLDNLWTDFRADTRIMEAKSGKERLAWAKEALDGAIVELDRVDVQERDIVSCRALYLL
ncbi:hypothetical protein CBS101457_004327 [Exobasidium rhododendri]|nr:hypothetical protein CBS101457_004327 [Exobasidium rhododendri]